MNKLLFFILVFSLLFGCSSGDERGIKDSRKDFMVELQKSMDKEGIPYSMDEEGYIRYSSQYKDDVERIKKNIDENRLSEIGTKFEDKSATEYFRELLNESGIEYRTEVKKDGDWTYWHPKNKKQQNEMEMKVVTHAFEKQAEHSDSK